jgi:hypothetical protein
MSRRTKSLEELLCDSFIVSDLERQPPRHRFNYENVLMEMLGVMANPLRMVHEFRQEGWIVSLMNLEAIVNISHTISCDILRVPCTDGWIDGVSRGDVLLTNEVSSSSRPTPGVGTIGKSQERELEQLFRRRECFYSHYFVSSNPGVTVVPRPRGEILWSNCPNREPTLYDVQLAENTTFFISKLRGVAGCGLSSHEVPRFRNKVPEPDLVGMIIVYYVIMSLLLVAASVILRKEHGFRVQIRQRVVQRY